MKKFVLAAALIAAATFALSAQNSDITLPQKPNTPKYVDYSSLDKGFFGAVQLSPMIAIDKLGGTSGIYQMDLVAGYRFGEYFRIGAGVSPRFNRIKYLPLYLDLRGSFISQASRMCVPYWSFDAGYTLSEGVYVAPTLGVRVGGPRHDFIVGIGYVYQGFQAIKGAQGSLSCAALRLGYEF